MWIDKIALFLMGAAIVLLQDFSYISIIIITSTIAASCLCGYFDKKLPVAIVSLLWLVMSLIFHDYLWMCGLITFEITRQKAYMLYIIPIIAHLVAGLYFSVLTPFLLVFSLVIMGAGIIFAIKENKIQSAIKEIISIRDKSVETELNLNQRNEQLEREQSSEIEIATLKERGRIAMEIHDNVGHILSRAILQTGAMITTTKDEKTKENLDELGETLKSAMGSIRDSVHDLKDDSFNLQKSIQDCIDEFPSFDCTFHYDINNNAPKNVKYCFAVIVKEAFSNVAKHSNASKIKIVLQEHPAFYKLTFTDNGTSAAENSDSYNDVQRIPAEKTKGIGLDNMKERAEALNGTFNTYTDNGFAIHVVLPKISIRI